MTPLTIEKQQTINLGRQGENLASTIKIDVSSMLKEYPEAVISLLARRKGDLDPYFPDIVVADGILIWQVTKVDTAIAGSGKIEVQAISGDILKKSVVLETYVSASLSGSATTALPDSTPSWVDGILQKAGHLAEALNEADGLVSEINAAGTAQCSAIAAKGEQTLASIPVEYTELNESVEAIRKDYAPAIILTTGGNAIAAVADSAKRPLAGLSLFGKTTQAGTPTPEAPVPMVNAGAGGSISVQVRGKNLFDSSTLTKQNGAMFEVNENTVHIYTPSSTTYCAVRTSAITMHAGIRYVMSADVSDIVSGEPSLGFRDADTMRYVKRAYVSDGRIVLTYTPTETVRMYACLLVTGSTASDGDATFANIQLEVGTSAVAYEPFKDGGSMTIATPNGLPGLPVDSGGNYTDASGQQWICDEIDFVRKVYVKRVHHAIYDGGITPYSSAVRDNTVRITLYNNNPRLADNHVNAVGNMTVLAAVFYDDRVGHSVSNTGTSTGWHLSLPKAIVGNTVDSLRAWLKNNPAEIMYVMATPVETPLSPEELTGSTSLTAQYPNTTAFTDAGAGMKMEYIADTKLYIDNKFAALAAASVDA